MSSLGTFAFDGMTIEVESLHSRTLTYEVFWLHRIEPEPKCTVAIRRPTGMALANEVLLDATALDTALTRFLIRRSDRAG